MCLDSALDLWPPGHFALGFFARIGRSEMECSALGLLMYVENHETDNSLLKMGSFHQSSRSNNNRYAVEVK